MFLAVFGLANVSFARVQYDSTGRKIIYDDTIRARKHAQQIQQTRGYQAAAKINYQEQNQKIYEMPSNLTPNYYQMKNDKTQQ